MAEKDIKKSLSLKSHKSSGVKQSKASAGSKNVTIQVRRKKIIKPDSLVKEDIASPVNEVLETTKEIIKNPVKDKIKIKEKTSSAKLQNAITEQPLSKKKTKIDKDEKLKYLSKISKNLFDYQKEDYPDKTELKNLLFEAYEKFNNKRKELNVSSKTRIAINLYDLYAVFDFKGGKVNFSSKDNIIGEENISEKIIMK